MLTHIGTDSKSIEDVIQIQRRSMSDPTLSAIDFKKWNDLGWTILKWSTTRFELELILFLDHLDHQAKTNAAELVKIVTTKR